jgi:hypothetical protein
MFSSGSQHSVRQMDLLDIRLVKAYLKVLEFKMSFFPQLMHSLPQHLPQICIS